MDTDELVRCRASPSLRGNIGHGEDLGRTLKGKKGRIRRVEKTGRIGHGKT